METNRAELNRAKCLLDQLPRESCDLREVLRDEHDLHSVPRGIDPVPVFSEKRLPRLRDLIDLLTSGPKPPHLIQNDQGTVRAMLPDRIRRGDNRRHRKFAEEVFRIRYVAHDHVALHRHVSHDQPPLAKRGKDLLRNGSVGLPGTRQAHVCKNTHLPAAHQKSHLMQRQQA